MPQVHPADPPTFAPRLCVLEGRHVRLEPLEQTHAADLFDAAQDDGIWLYMPIPRPATPADVERMIAAAVRARDAGREIPFAIIHKETGRAVGSTRYLDLDADRGTPKMHIGWTWLGVVVQRTPVNTECKYLLLRHAFETLGAVRVYLRTDGRNERSQRAILRIGATHEGTLRRDRLMWDGHIRDTVIFSILADEWPPAKAALEEKLAPRILA